MGKAQRKATPKRPKAQQRSRFAQRVAKLAKAKGHPVTFTMGAGPFLTVISRKGRKPSLASDQIAEGIRILRGQPRMSLDAARSTLRQAGIDTSDSSLYRLIIHKAYDISK